MISKALKIGLISSN